MKIDSELGKDLVDILKKYSPLIATAVGGPYGGMVAGLLSTFFGLDPQSATPQDLAVKISADPDTNMKLVSFQYQHETALQKIWADNYKVEVQDRIDARSENISPQNKYPWAVHLISAIITLGFVAATLGILTTKSDPGDHDILNMILGIMGATFGQVSAYYLGSGNKNNVK